MNARNLTRSTLLATNLEVADTPFARCRGLLGRDTLPGGHGMLITRCQSIHMFFMKFPIDAIFINAQGRVVGLLSNILPNRISPIFWQARSVIELPVGTIDQTGTRVGDLIEWA